ncbi:MAG TPA: hypothetical protein VGD43_12480 [Micromonospora sp.]
MLDAGGGGGYSGTNWNAYDVKQMWALLEGQETDNHWKQVAGWRKTYELTSTHLYRLKEYRNNLAEVWSPSRSEAAAAYLSRLDFLIDSVQQTYDAAVANYGALSSATAAVGTSRYQLKQIYDQYVVKEQQKQEFDNKTRANPLVPPLALGVTPVTQTELDQLNNQARTIMFSLSGELSQAQVQLRQPPAYKPPKAQITGGGSGGSDTSGGGTTTPPAIPPITTIPDGPSGPPSGPRSTPPPLQPIPVPTAPTGPILGGIGPLSPPIAPTGPVPPTVITPSPTPGGPFPGMPPGMPIGPGGPVPTSPMPGGNRLVKPGMGSPVNVARAMPPGGVIGATPSGVVGQQPRSGVPARRINPVGGVIGQSPVNGKGVPGQTAGRPGLTPAQRGGQHGAGVSARPGVHGEDDELLPRWDPDNPWETDEGVAPVVLPAQETGRIDPGPAIGFNR